MHHCIDSKETTFLPDQNNLFLVVELHQGGSATKVATLFSFCRHPKAVIIRRDIYIYIYEKG